LPEKRSPHKSHYNSLSPSSVQLLPPKFTNLAYPIPISGESYDALVPQTHGQLGARVRACGD